MPRSQPVRFAAAADNQPRRNVERPLENDRATDVGSVLRAEAVLDVGTDRVEFASERIDVHFGQMRVGSDLADSHSKSLDRWDGARVIPMRVCCPSHPWTRTLCRASTISATSKSTRFRPVEHPDQRSRQERRFPRSSLRQRRLPVLAWWPSIGAVDPARRLRAWASNDGLAEATATSSDTKIGRGLTWSVDMRTTANWMASASGRLACSITVSSSAARLTRIEERFGLRQNPPIGRGQPEVAPRAIRPSRQGGAPARPDALRRVRCEQAAQ